MNDASVAVDLSDWLLEQIATDRQAAQAVTNPRWPNISLHYTREFLDCLGQWTPARVLAECEAKRRIVEDIASPDYDEIAGVAEYAPALDRPLRLLALPYADREGYREEWRP